MEENYTSVFDVPLPNLVRKRIIKGFDVVEENQRKAGL